MTWRCSMLAKMQGNVSVRLCLTIQLVSVTEHSPSWFRRQPIVVQYVRYPSVRSVDCSLGIRTTSDGTGAGSRAARWPLPRPGPTSSWIRWPTSALSDRLAGNTTSWPPPVYWRHLSRDSRPSSVRSIRRVTPVPMLMSDEDLSA